MGEYYTSTTTSRGTFWAFGYTSFALSSFYLEATEVVWKTTFCVAIGGTGSSNVCKRAFGSSHPGECPVRHRRRVMPFSFGDDGYRLLCYLSTVAGGKTAMMP